MQTKNIWVINQFAGTPESGWGERHFYFAKYWKEKGYNVTIISSSFNHMFNKVQNIKEAYKEENFEGVNFYWLKTPSYDPKSVKRFLSMLVFAWRILFLKRYLQQKPDAIIVSSMPIFPILPAYILKNRFKCQLIFEVRDIWPLSLIQIAGISKFHPLALFIGWFEKFGYRKSDYIVSLLPNAEAHMLKVAKRNLNFVYIPNGADMDGVGRDKVDAAILEKLPGTAELIIGYAGTLGRANALEFFIRAARNVSAKCPGIHFILLGDGYMKGELMSEAGNCTNIHFLPKVPKSQVQDILKYFDVCYIGWRDHKELYKNGISANKYFDYMLASKPVLDSNNLIKGPIELSGGGIIVQPESVKSIEEGVLAFYEMGKEGRERLGKEGYDYVLKFHSIRSLSQRYINLFE